MRDLKAGDEFDLGEFHVVVKEIRSGKARLDFFDKDGKRVKVEVSKNTAVIDSRGDCGVT